MSQSDATADASAIVEVRMPKLGDTVVEGTVEQWLVSVGDMIAEGTSLLSISTDKVSTEYPSELAGEVVELVADEGDTLPVGAVIVRVRTVRAPSATAPSAATSSMPPAVAPAPTAAPPAPLVSIPTEPAGPRATGAARAAAARDAVSLATVTGTGRQGRVVASDVLAHAQLRRTGNGHSVMRRMIAQRMTHSWKVNQHASVFAEADIESLLESRTRERAGYRRRTGTDLTLLPFVVDAYGRVLGAPAPIGVAVDIGTGLLVPVVNSAGTGWERVADEMTQLVSAARTNTLDPGQTHGGVSTVTNVGTWGAQHCQPILNGDQPTILGVGAASTGVRAARRGLGWSTLLPLSLTYDRNRLDEFAAADLLTDLVAAIEAAPLRAAV